MAEPIPPTAQNPPNPPTGVKAAESAALSNLNEPSTTSASDPDTGAAPTGTAHNDAALGAAVSNLSLQGEERGAGKGEGKKEGEALVKRKIRVRDEDVKFLVEELEVGRRKAEEMLRAAEGEREGAMRDYVLPKKRREESKA